MKRCNRGAFTSLLPRHRRGATLIDVATGSMLLAVLLIPAVRLIGQSQSARHRLAVRDTMLFEAENLVSATQIALSESTTFDAAFSSPTDSVGTIAVSDGPDLARRVRVAADTSVAGEKLLTIVVDVWQDSDQDASMDGDELGETLRTQWAAP